MTNPRSKIAVEGLPIIGVLTVLAWIAAMSNFKVVSVILAALAFFTLYFFRDPERITPQDPGAVLAPADGKIIEVENSRETDFLNRDMTRVSIFLSITDCHINRFPIAGRVVNAKYTPGKFHAAYLKRASSENERLSTLIETEDKDEIVVVQIAGVIARRIISYVAPGDSLRRGDRFGMIKFGSRTDLYIPPGCEVTASVGDKVRGGETIIGWLKGRET